MCDWDKDDFMSNWDKTYVSTNVPPDATAYDKDFFMSLNVWLSETRPELQDFSYAIIAVVACAVGRADVVGRFFDHLTTDSAPDESQHVFLMIREAITIVFPFLGMPTCIPACYGMIGVVERKAKEAAQVEQGHGAQQIMRSYGATVRIRKLTLDEEDVQKGRDLRRRIYRGVGNEGIFGLMEKYFADLYNSSTNFTWGYLHAATNEAHIYELHQSHLIVAVAITALGATRQTRSHLKATIGVGNSIETVKAVVSTVAKIAAWAGTREAFVVPDVDGLAEQIRAAIGEERGKKELS